MKIIAAISTAVILTACSFGDIATVSRFMAFDNYPVVKASTKYDDQPAATKQQVIAAGGQPKSMTPIKYNNGVCFDYDLRKDDFVQPYFVAFDAKNTVYYYGYLTCAKADGKGLLNPANAQK